MPRHRIRIHFDGSAGEDAYDARAVKTRTRGLSARERVDEMALVKTERSGDFSADGVLVYKAVDVDGTVSFSIGFPHQLVDGQVGSSHDLTETQAVHMAMRAEREIQAILQTDPSAEVVVETTGASRGGASASIFQRDLRALYADDSRVSSHLVQLDPVPGGFHAVNSRMQSTYDVQNDGATHPELVDHLRSARPLELPREALSHRRLDPAGFQRTTVVVSTESAMGEQFGFAPQVVLGADRVIVTGAGHNGSATQFGSSRMTHETFESLAAMPAGVYVVPDGENMRTFSAESLKPLPPSPQVGRSGQVLADSPLIGGDAYDSLGSEDIARQASHEMDAIKDRLGAAGVHNKAGFGRMDVVGQVVASAEHRGFVTPGTAEVLGRRMNQGGMVSIRAGVSSSGREEARSYTYKPSSSFQKKIGGVQAVARSELKDGGSEYVRELIKRGIIHGATFGDPVVDLERATPEQVDAFVERVRDQAVGDMTDHELDATNIALRGSESSFDQKLDEIVEIELKHSGIDPANATAVENFSMQVREVWGNQSFDKIEAYANRLQQVDQYVERALGDVPPNASTREAQAFSEQKKRMFAEVAEMPSEEFDELQRIEQDKIRQGVNRIKGRKQAFSESPALDDAFSATDAAAIREAATQADLGEIQTAYAKNTAIVESNAEQILAAAGKIPEGEQRSPGEIAAAAFSAPPEEMQRNFSNANARLRDAVKAHDEALPEGFKHGDLMGRFSDSVGGDYVAGTGMAKVLSNAISHTPVGQIASGEYGDRLSKIGEIAGCILKDNSETTPVKISDENVQQVFDQLKDMPQEDLEALHASMKPRIDAWKGLGARANEMTPAERVEEVNRLVQQGPAEASVDVAPAQNVEPAEPVPLKEAVDLGTVEDVAEPAPPAPVQDAAPALAEAESPEPAVEPAPANPYADLSPEQAAFIQGLQQWQEQHPGQAISPEEHNAIYEEAYGEPQVSPFAEVQTGGDAMQSGADEIDMSQYQSEDYQRQLAEEKEAQRMEEDSLAQDVSEVVGV